MSNLGGSRTARQAFLSPTAVWNVHASPFPYALAQDVFEAEVYARIEARGLALLGSAVGRTENYDAAILKIDARIAADLDPLFSAEWLSLLRDVLALDTNNQIDAAIHDHPAGSRPGWVHNDFNPGRFAPGPDDAPVFSGDSSIDYRVRAGADDAGRASLRRLAGIFYFGNPDWSAEHGGETGLYWNNGAEPRLARTVAPLDNSLLLFECSPHSFHRFLGARRRRRSIVFWLHAPLEDLSRRWPGAQPVYWP